VACGRLDGLWEYGLKAWDVAAGTLLIREAGGTAKNTGGDKATASGIIAGNIKIESCLSKAIGLE